VKRIGIVVVAYNAASTLATVLDRIPDAFVPRIDGILVCDNASEDPTYLVGLGYQQATQRPLPLTIMRQERNLGYGGNQKTGYRWAIEQGFDIAVLLHADGQYAPEFLAEMVAPLERGEADAVFGSRMMQQGGARGGGMPLYKFVGNTILSRFENRVVGTDLSEWHSGYRAYAVEALKDVPFEANSDDYDFDTGIILQMHEAGKRIVEIPIPTFYGDEISYVNGMRYAKDIVRDVLVYRAAKLGIGDSATSHPSTVITDPAVAEGTGGRLATWLSRGEGDRVLVIAPPDVASVATEHLDGRHQVTVVELDDDEDPWAITDAALHDIASTDDDGGFDAILVTGLLERLGDPDLALTALRSALSPSGTLVLAVPNFSHWYPRFKVATGRFNYEHEGPLSERSLRFFTRSTLDRLLRSCGLEPSRWESQGLTGAGTGERPSRWSVRADALGLMVAPKFFGATILVEARPMPHGSITND
jgi:hypothetical protein